MRRILCFGDSVTWGCRPDNTLLPPYRRWSDEERWPGVLQAELGSGYQVIPEGLASRTAVHEVEYMDYRCGKDQILPCMDTWDPLDLVIIFLGINDLKTSYHFTPEDVANGVAYVAGKAMGNVTTFADMKPRVLVICPYPLGKIENGLNKNLFCDAVEKSRELAPHFERAAELFGFHWMDAGKYVHASDRDGVHLEVDQHLILGREVAKVVRDIFAQEEGEA